MIVADGGLNGEPSKITTSSPEHPKEMRLWIGDCELGLLINDFACLGFRV